MNTRKSIEALNKLLQVNIGRITQYKTLTHAGGNNELNSFFSGCIHTSTHCAEELVAEIEHLGGDPISAAQENTPLHTVLSHKESIPDIVEDQEDKVLEMYNAVLTHEIDYLTIEQHKMIYKQYVQMKAEHNLSRSIKNNKTLQDQH